jgi:hypothetical protein
MLKENVVVTAIRPREGQALAPMTLGNETAAPPATVLQMILGELASLKQQVNALTLARPAPMVPEPQQEPEPVPQRRVERQRLRDMFD